MTSFSFPLTLGCVLLTLFCVSACQGSKDTPGQNPSESNTPIQTDPDTYSGALEKIPTQISALLGNFIQCILMIEGEGTGSTHLLENAAFTLATSLSYSSDEQLLLDEIAKKYALLSSEEQTTFQKNIQAFPKIVETLSQSDHKTLQIHMKESGWLSPEIIDTFDTKKWLEVAKKLVEAPTLPSL